MIFVYFFCFSQIFRSFLTATLVEIHANFKIVALLFQHLRFIFSVKGSVMLKKKRDQERDARFPFQEHFHTLKGSRVFLLESQIN